MALLPCVGDRSAAAQAQRCQPTHQTPCPLTHHPCPAPTNTHLAAGVLLFQGPAPLRIQHKARLQGRFTAERVFRRRGVNSYLPAYFACARTHAPRHTACPSSSATQPSNSDSATHIVLEQHPHNVLAVADDRQVHGRAANRHRHPLIKHTLVEVDEVGAVQQQLLHYLLAPRPHSVVQCGEATDVALVDKPSCMG